VCFSKGLGAPVGSALAGTKEFIARARRFRKQFGGGMRQAGMMAAGALYALEHNRARLVEDHANARLFAEGIHGLPGVEVDPAAVETNIVVFRATSMPAADLSALLRGKGLLMNANGPDTIRAVTHLDVNRADLERAVEIMRNVMG
jgi:threonine aldolase